nr:chitin-binding protein [Bacillus paranthracis]
MFKEKTNRRLKKIVIITAACTMMSMYGAPISSTEAAIRSHAPSVYVTPQNNAASDKV